jgi:protocadherin Fat 1/2/3
MGWVVMCDLNVDSFHLLFILFSEIYYSLLNETETFSVHPSSGVLTLTRSLETSGNTYFQLTVLATDRASLLLNNVNSQSNFKSNQHAASKASVEIFVQQTNLHTPEIHLQALNEVVENSNANIYGIVRVTDGDQGIHGEIKSLEVRNCPLAPSFIMFYHDRVSTDIA